MRSRGPSRIATFVSRSPKAKKSCEGCDDDGRSGDAAPEPGAAAGEHVFLLQAPVVDAEEARPRDDAPEADLDDPAEGRDRAHGGEKRPVPAPAELAVELQV